MPSQWSYVIEPGDTPPLTPGDAGTKPPPGRTTLAFLGSCLARPFRRDGRGDFANLSGVALVKAAVGQVLGTDASSDNGKHSGELPWRPRFGSLLRLLVHRNLDDPMTVALARYYVAESLNRWEPRVRVRKVWLTPPDDPKLDKRAFVVRLRYDIITQNVAGNAVVESGVEQAVTITGS